MNKVIGLTGGIASGKSTVSDFLLSEGYTVVDADKVVRELQAPQAVLNKAIREQFGADFFDEEGKLLREKLGRLIFSDETAREKLGALQGKIIRAELYRRREKLLNQENLKNAVFFMDIPLLIEQNYDELFDEIWLVTLPESEQIHRLMARNGLSEQEAKARIASQMPLSEKIPRASRLLDNSGSRESLLKQVKSALEEVKK